MKQLPYDSYLSIEPRGSFELQIFATVALQVPCSGEDKVDSAARSAGEDRRTRPAQTKDFPVGRDRGYAS